MDTRHEDCDIDRMKNKLIHTEDDDFKEHVFLNL